jgi:hypothetical protein
LIDEKKEENKKKIMVFYNFQGFDIYQKCQKGDLVGLKKAAKNNLLSGNNEDGGYLLVTAAENNHLPVLKFLMKRPEINKGNYESKNIFNREPRFLRILREIDYDNRYLRFTDISFNVFVYDSGLTLYYTYLEYCLTKTTSFSVFRYLFKKIIWYPESEKTNDVIAQCIENAIYFNRPSILKGVFKLFKSLMNQRITESRIAERVYNSCCVFYNYENDTIPPQKRWMYRYIIKHLPFKNKMARLSRIRGSKVKFSNKKMKIF